MKKAAAESHYILVKVMVNILQLNDRVKSGWYDSKVVIFGLEDEERSAQPIKLEAA